MAQASSLAGLPRAELRLRMLVGAVGALAAACIVVAVLAAGTMRSVPPQRLLLAIVLFCAGDLASVPVRFAGERHVLVWSEAAVVFGLVLVPRPWLCVCAWIGVILTQVARGRDPLKIVFSSATMTVATAAAYFVLAAFGQPDGLAGPTRWAALAAAAAVCFAVNTMAVSAAVAFSQGRRVRTVLVRRLEVKLAVFAVNTGIALLLVELRWNPAASLAVPAILVASYLAYRAYLRARDDTDSWRLLERVSKELIGLQPRDIAQRVIDQAVAAMQADGAEMFVRRRDGRVDHYWGTPESRRHEVVDGGVLSAMELTPNTLISTVPHWAQSGERVPFTVTVPLEAADVVGALRLRLPGQAALSGRDRHFLLTFSRSVALNLANALLFEDVEDAARRHEHAATHDELTGLPNRTLLMRHAARMLPEDGVGRCALLLLDLDHFKSINDTLGHGTGDRLLVALAHRLSRAAPADSVVARLGGDEFAVFLSGLPAAEHADALADLLLDALAQPVLLDGLRLSAEASVGVSCHPDDATDVEELLAHADVALYQAKTVRGSRRRYRADHDESSLSRLAVAADLRSALGHNRLVLHYQPQYRLSDGAISGAEALVRWQHPTRGLLPPEEFIAVAEDSGLAHDFARHVLAMAVAEAAGWQRADRQVHVSVNLSARNLLDPDLPRAVLQVLEEHDLAPGLLVLEITETTMMAELDTVAQALLALRALGVQISVDDFGTGYSSLRFLTRNAVNELKIDREFVLRMTTSDADAAVVRATVELGHSLGVRVVAEGVEDAATLAALRQLDCDIAQGYLLARPTTGAAVRERLNRTDVLVLHGDRSARARSQARATS